MKTVPLFAALILCMGTLIGLAQYSSKIEVLTIDSSPSYFIDDFHLIALSLIPTLSAPAKTGSDPVLLMKDVKGKVITTKMKHYTAFADTVHSYGQEIVLFSKVYTNSQEQELMISIGGKRAVYCLYTKGEGDLAIERKEIFIYKSDIPHLIDRLMRDPGN